MSKKSKDREITLVMTGAGGVGKSALTIQFIKKTFVKKYDPTVEEVYQKPIDIEGEAYRLEIIDTAGTEQFNTMHDLYMRNGQGFACVFSLTSQVTFHDTESIRRQIVKLKDTEDVPLVLVGNKADLTDARAVAKDKAQEMADKLFGGRYFETSAMNGSNVPELFDDLVQQCIPKLPKPKKRSGACTIL